MVVCKRYRRGLLRRYRRGLVKRYRRGLVERYRRGLVCSLASEKKIDVVFF